MPAYVYWEERLKEECPLYGFPIPFQSPDMRFKLRDVGDYVGDKWALAVRVGAFYENYLYWYWNEFAPKNPDDKFRPLPDLESIFYFKLTPWIELIGKQQYRKFRVSHMMAWNGWRQKYVSISKKVLFVRLLTIEVHEAAFFEPEKFKEMIQYDSNRLYGVHRCN